MINNNTMSPEKQNTVIKQGEYKVNLKCSTPQKGLITNPLTQPSEGSIKYLQEHSDSDLIAT